MTHATEGEQRPPNSTSGAQRDRVDERPRHEQRPFSADRPVPAENSRTLNSPQEGSRLPDNASQARSHLTAYLKSTGWLAPARPSLVGELWRHPDSEWMMAVPCVLDRAGMDWRRLVDRLAAIEGCEPDDLISRIDRQAQAVHVVPAHCGRLIAIVQAHMDRHGVSEAEVARRIGASPATVNAWRNSQLRRPPRREYLEGLADLTGVAYADILVAALIDSGYINRDGRRP
ncbi:Helix-turn-helix protein [Mycobacteroides abscessus subsp. abscessus]|uniref:Helix-turn-helix protein n=1 Tax=Mycobacteroides abscessus TaxID=36809 RepID=A0AB33TF88_9MYCO|nr:helix-turn-helix transcriptional regulator [Mycobacteroides abscessus]MDO3086305.1 helix-turn-helix transcriptional regulator [Mycobacteroides abscessus subsp. abscessus]MDO3105224.1 helix-turn-helix transcriptional regulator [Mycobacteroides abscessus subsp. abscessus]CPT40112.1 Helix-turn-helix protein [Mycobacteroides abscessus]CPT52468.1 Helix-turn-helix protein [Mycobacteroides abscessus]CPT59020.1 Helix-turn-helix protein [Mycobacteroides abscessus]